MKDSFQQKKFLSVKKQKTFIDRRRSGIHYNPYTAEENTNLYTTFFMKIAFLSNNNPNDIHLWSGTTRHIYQMLSKHHELVWLGGNMVNGGLWHHCFKGCQEKYYPENYTRAFARILSAEINKYKCNIVITCDYYFATDLQLDIPIAYISDATFNQFRHYLNISDGYYGQLAEATEQRLIDNVDVLLYSSEWVKSNAIEHYHAESSKINVVEFGANMPTPTKYQTTINMDVCHLVFIGRSWEKKGGDKALEAYRYLKDKGFPCSLTIIGCMPSVKINKDENLLVIPFLDKSKKGDMEQLKEILYYSHFLILPTTFDAYGIVFCEASAYGVPSIAANVGGVSQPVREGKNGFLLPPTSSGKDYAKKILSIYSDKEKYINLRKSCRKEFENRLNWDVWSKKVNAILKKVVSQKQKENISATDYFIPVYAINLKSRPDRRKHIEEQFKGRAELDLHIIEAVKDTNGRVGLWKSMVKVIKKAIANNDDIIIICEDDHAFTEAYTKEYLMANIIGAEEQQAELLSGGIGGFGHAVPVAGNRYWIDWFWCTQFIVLFKPLFKKILAYQFRNNDTADGVLSALATSKMTLYPFLSIQTDFGYSDVTVSNDRCKGLISRHFQETDRRLRMIHCISHHFNNK